MLSLVVVGPLLAPGFTLAYDMVFVPHPHFTADLLGLSAAQPRTVPTQAIVTTLSAAVGGQIVQKAALLGIFGLAALGAGRLVRARHPAASVVAGVLYAWNPFTYERLLLGQWALLLGGALLPWALHAAFAWRRGEPGAGRRMTLWLAAMTAASPYTGLIGGTTAVAAGVWPDRPRPARLTAKDPGARRPRGWMLVGALAVVSLPWLVPAVLHPAEPGRPRLAVEAFRARSDSPPGTVGSLLSLGGLWRTDLAPPGRTSWAWVPAFALILAVAATGWRRLQSSTPRGWRRGLVTAAAVGLVLAAAPSLPLLAAAMRWVGAHVPGAGVLRDSQKFVLPWAALLAVSFGSGVDLALDRGPGSRRASTLMAAILAALPLALAPTLAWGAWGRLQTAEYPASWSTVERVTSHDPAAGAIMVLPWHAYVPFPWNHGQAVHQPAPLYFSRRVVVATSLEVGGRRIPGEDPWSRLLDGPATRRGPLAPALSRLGVRYVVAISGPWGSVRRKVAGLEEVVRSPDLTLYRSTPVTDIPAFGRPPLWPIAAGDVAASGLVVWAAAGAWRRRVRARAGPAASPPSL